jgi:ribonuclease HI
MQKIETIQNDIIRLIFGLRKPRSTKFLLRESGLTTMRERHSFLLIKHLTKIESNSSHTLHNWLRNPAMYRGIADEYANIQKKFPVPAKSIAPTFPQSPPWNWSIPIINTDFSKWTKDLTPIAFVQKKFAELNTITYKNHFQIFVDGSKMNEKVAKMNEKVASGAFLPHLKIAMGERLYNNVSIMSAELNAIIMALEHLMENKPLIANSNNIIVYSDSLSSLELLSSAPQYKLDIDTYHCLSIIDNLASSGIRTYLQYIPSHSGISGNHQVDEIAKNAINIDQPSGRPIPIRDIYRWRLSDIMFNKKNPTLSPFPNKYFSKIYHRIRSGTNGLNFLAFSYQFPNSSGSVPLSPLCRYCIMNNETIDHCLFECNMLTSAQISLSAKSLANYTCTQSTEIDIYHLIFEFQSRKIY